MESVIPKLRALHVGDLHFWRIPLNPFMYFNKRLLGVGNLVIGGRSRKFRQEMAPRLVDRLIELAPDVLLFSGDFSSTSVPSEFEAARMFLEPVIREARLGAHSVPGNHDCYFRSEMGARSFAEKLGHEFRPVRDVAFQLLENEVALVQVNATTLNGLGSHGEITDNHAKQIRQFLEDHREQTKAVWFLCHFPGEDPPAVEMRDRGPQLRGTEKLFDEFRSIAVPILWLHGHHHHRWVYGSPTLENLIYLNAGAPFLKREGRPPDLGFHEIIYDEGKTRVYSHRFSLQTQSWIDRQVLWPDPKEYVDLQAWE